MVDKQIIIFVFGGNEHFYKQTLKTKNHSLKIAFLLAFPMEVYYMSFTV